MDIDSRVIPLHRHPLGFIEAFTDLGAELHPLLRGTGISPALFGMQEARISYRQLQVLFHNALELLPDANLGVKVGLLMDWSFWGPVGNVVNCSPCLKDAGEAFRRYLTTAQPYYAMQTSRPNTYLDADNRVVEPLDYPTAASDDDMELRNFILDFRLAVTVRLWDECGNKSVNDTRIDVRLRQPEPVNPDDVLYQLPCTSITFGAEEAQVSAGIDFVVEPFRPLRKRAFEQIIQQCERELESVPVPVSFSDRVRWHVRAHFNRHLDLETVAEGMQITPRSLTRRLALEDESFRNLLCSVRMEIASHQLRSSTLSVEEVSDLLGFSCASSLRRAVKNWSGNTIGQIREVAS